MDSNSIFLKSNEENNFKELSDDSISMSSILFTDTNDVNTDFTDTYDLNNKLINIHNVLIDSEYIPQTIENTSASYNTTTDNNSTTYNTPSYNIQSSSINSQNKKPLYNTSSYTSYDTSYHQTSSIFPTTTFTTPQSIKMPTNYNASTTDSGKKYKLISSSDSRK